MLVKDALEKYFQLHMDAVKTHKITPENFMGTEGKIWHETVTAARCCSPTPAPGPGPTGSRRTRSEQQQWDNVGFMLIPAAQKGGKPAGHPLAPAGLHGHRRQQEQELAFRLIAAATTPELNSKHSVESAHLAILKSQEKDPTYQKDKFLLAAATCPSSRFVPNHRSSAPTTGIFRLLSAVQAGQMQPKQAVEVATTELQAQLKDDLIVK